MLVAKSFENSRFDRWEGDCVGVAERCAIALDRRGSVSARFERLRTRVQLLVGAAQGVSGASLSGLGCGASSDACEADFGWGDSDSAYRGPNGGSRALQLGRRLPAHERHDLRSSWSNPTPSFRRRCPDRGAAVNAAGADRRESGRRAREERSAGDRLPARLLGVAFPPSAVVRLPRVGRHPLARGLRRTRVRVAVVLNTPTNVAVESPRLAHLHLLRPRLHRPRNARMV